MIIKEITDKYMFWNDNGETVLTNRKRTEIFRGSESECKAIAADHPYGMTNRKIEEFRNSKEKGGCE